jgi:eukaryotic-like serine/threonine-protein kinase
VGPPVVEEDRYLPPRRPPVPEIWPWLLLFLLLVIGGLVAAFFLTRDHKHHAAGTVAVPAVVGMKQDEAARRLSERGLVPVATAKVSKSLAGTVLAQDPVDGMEVAPHSRVELSVAAVSLAQVPDVVGSKSSAALARLQAVGLTGQVTTVPAQAAAGIVVAEVPAAGAKVAKGSTVSLKASTGPATVPDVRGQPAADAKGALRTAGLVPVEFQVPGNQPKGTVTAMKPLPNKNVPSSRPMGVVTGQNDPGGGTKVKKGSTVLLAVSRRPNPSLTIVPDVVGKTQQSATTTLQNAGFRVQVLKGEAVQSQPERQGRRRAAVGQHSRAGRLDSEDLHRLELGLAGLVGHGVGRQPVKELGQGF